MEHLLLLPRIAKWENILGLLRVGQVLMVGCNPYRAKQKLQDQNTIDCSVPKVCTYPQRCTPQNKTAAFPCAAYKIRDIIIQFPLRLSVKRTMVGTLKHPSFPGGCFCFEVITMIDTYTRQITALEARLAELRADHDHRHDDSHSSRVALLEREIADLRISAKHLRERQYKCNDKNRA